MESPWRAPLPEEKLRNQRVLIGDRGGTENVVWYATHANLHFSGTGGS